VGDALLLIPLAGARVAARAAATTQPQSREAAGCVGGEVVNYVTPGSPINS